MDNYITALIKVKEKIMNDFDPDSIDENIRDSLAKGVAIHSERERELLNNISKLLKSHDNTKNELMTLRDKYAEIAGLAQSAQKKAIELNSDLNLILMKMSVENWSES